VAVSLEPLQLAYERFILAEALAMLVLASLLAVALAYVERPRLIHLMAAAVLGVLLLGLRLNYVPFTWLVAVALPIFAWQRLGEQTTRSRRKQLRLLAAHVLVSLLATGAAHTAYRQIFGALTATPPAYQNATGLFAIAAWAPLVKPTHFPDGILGDELLRRVEYPLHDSSRREDQRWEPGGLVRTLERTVGSELNADWVAKRIAWRIGLEDPLGVIRLGAGTLASYFIGPELRAGLDYDLGPKALPGGLEGLHPFSNSLGAETVGPSLTRNWHRGAWWWYPALLLCPGAAMILAFGAPPAYRPSLALIGLLSGAVVMTGPFLATMPVVRYLHPLGWVTVLLIGAAVAMLSAKSTSSVLRPLPGRRDRPQA
jgi:hypothetical protein